MPETRIIIFYPNRSVYTEKSDSLAEGQWPNALGERFQHAKTVVIADGTGARADLLLMW